MTKEEKDYVTQLFVEIRILGLQTIILQDEKSKKLYKDFLISISKLENIVPERKDVHVNKYGIEKELKELIEDFVKKI